MKPDPVEPLQRNAAVLLGAVEAALTGRERAWLRSEEKRGAHLQLSMTLNGEMWVAVVRDGCTVAVPWLLNRRGFALSMTLPHLPDRPAPHAVLSKAVQ